MQKKLLSFLILFIMSAVFLTKPNSSLQVAAFTIEEARENQNENRIENANVTGNLRDSNDNNMHYENNQFSMSYTGLWLRSTTVFKNDFVGCEYLLYNDEKTKTNFFDYYYKATLAWENAKSSRAVGIVLGKAPIAETQEEVYVCCNLIPYDKMLSFYYYKKSNGEGDQNVYYPITNVDILTTQTVLFEVLKNHEGVSVFINQNKIITLTDFQNDLAYSTSQVVGTISFSSMIPTPGANFMDIQATICDYQFKYLNEGTYQPYYESDEELLQAQENTSQNLFECGEVKLSTNKRDSELNGISYADKKVTAVSNGGWLRACNVFISDYFSSETLLKDENELSTKGVDAYYKANFTIHSKNENRILGLVFAKKEILDETCYLSANISPGSNTISLYFFTSKPYDFVFEQAADFIINENQEYTLEILLVHDSIRVYIDGKKYLDVQEYDVRALFSDVSTHVTLTDLIPCFGTNFMDIDAVMYNFEMKYLCDYDAIKIYVEPTYPDRTKEYIYHTEPVEIHNEDFQLSDYYVLKNNKANNKNFSILFVILPIATVLVTLSIVTFLLLNKRKWRKRG